MVRVWQHGAMHDTFFEELERARLDALVEVRLADAEALHAPDYELIAPGGGVVSREEYLGALASGDMRYVLFEPVSAIRVLNLESAAALRYLARIEVHFKGGGADRGVFWHTDIYELRDGRWRAVWSQATRTDGE